MMLPNTYVTYTLQPRDAQVPRLDMIHNKSTPIITSTVCPVYNHTRTLLLLLPPASDAMLTWQQAQHYDVVFSVWHRAHVTSSAHATLRLDAEPDAADVCLGTAHVSLHPFIMGFTSITGWYHLVSHTSGTSHTHTGGQLCIGITPNHTLLQHIQATSTYQQKQRQERKHTRDLAVVVSEEVENTGYRIDPYVMVPSTPRTLQLQAQQQAQEEAKQHEQQQQQQQQHYDGCIPTRQPAVFTFPSVEDDVDDDMHTQEQKHVRNISSMRDAMRMLDAVQDRLKDKFMSHGTGTGTSTSTAARVAPSAPSHHLQVPRPITPTPAPVSPVSRTATSPSHLRIDPSARAITPHPVSPSRVSPAHHISSPVHSPMRSPSSMIPDRASPIPTSLSPVSLVRSPIGSPQHYATSPSHHAVSPSHHALSPLHHAVSPSHHALSPSHHVLSPPHQQLHV